MKILALDVGDAWTGVALSDVLGMFAKPYETVPSKGLISFLHTVLAKEPIKTVVIGYPKTMRGTESEQTKKIVVLSQQLTEKFPQVSWILWDERLTSQRADNLKRAKTKEDKIKSHAIAAAFILSSYLDHLQFIKE